MFEFDDMPVQYPIGEHNFRDLRERGCLYVDKTQYVARLLVQGKFIFLSRPRRFGKSLLLSTIESYFKGEKELFEGTWIGEREKNWKKYPVLHFDMSGCSGKNADTIEKFLNDRIARYETSYGVPNKEHLDDVGSRFNSLILNIYAATGCRVVVLIDEYDKGILETLDEPENKKMNDVLRAFYSQPKAATEAVQFCMVTGVARFGSYTLFSGPNNYYDISMNTLYASICGITQSELLGNFSDGIKLLSEKRKETQEDTIEALRQKYDSYRFTESEEKVYNPFSVLCAFAEQRMDNFWIKSGISKVFVKYLSQSEFDLIELQNLWVTRDRMEKKYSKEDSIPLLFQTGYLTIKDVEDSKLYRLGIPNGEVRSALVDQLIPLYTGIPENDFPLRLKRLQDKVKDGDVTGWIEDVRSIISRIPYRLFGPTDSNKEKEDERQDAKAKAIANYERTYHLLVHIIFQMLDLEAQSEIEIAGGRIDMVMKTKKFIYVIEFKLDGTTSEALAQIDEKGYLIPWRADGRKVYKIGIVFSSKDHNIKDYEYLPKD
ncbi:MAG: ATP-binding protein [Bacteroidales bacterium]|nr:ATP-binding protein [Bacteroidales bacterium]